MSTGVELHSKSNRGYVNPRSAEGVCFWCGVELAPVPQYYGEIFKTLLDRPSEILKITPQNMATIDHVLPFFRGGQNIKINRVWSCATCNRAKGKRKPTEDELRKAGLVMYQGEFKAGHFRWTLRERTADDVRFILTIKDLNKQENQDRMTDLQFRKQNRHAKGLRHQRRDAMQECSRRTNKTRAQMLREVDDWDD